MVNNAVNGFVSSVLSENENRQIVQLIEFTRTTAHFNALHVIVHADCCTRYRLACPPPKLYVHRTEKRMFQSIVPDGMESICMND